MSNKHKIAPNVIVIINKLINAANPECNVSGPNSPQRINPDASPIFHMKYRNITKAVMTPLPLQVGVSYSENPRNERFYPLLPVI